MESTVIGQVKYRDGHSSLGRQVISGQIIALPSNLTFQGLDGRGLISVPWENFYNAHDGVLEKTGLADAAATLLGAIPVVDLFSSYFYTGFWLRYWDNDIQREQDVFFDTIWKFRADQIVRMIFQCRDRYYSQTRNMSGPQRR